MQIVIGNLVELGGQYHRTSQQAQGSLRRALAYLCDEHESSAPVFFSRAAKRLSLVESVAYIAESFGPRIAFHSYRIAPSYQEGGCIQDWQAWALQIFQVWEATQSAPVRWVAQYHDCHARLQIEHRPYVLPHIHFILAGGCGEPVISDTIFDQRDIQLIIETAVTTLPSRQNTAFADDKLVLDEGTHSIAMRVHTLRQHLHIEATERNRLLLWNIVRELGPNQARDFVSEAHRQCKQDFPPASNTRRHTVWGVYLQLIRASITPDQKSKLFGK